MNYKILFVPQLGNKGQFEMEYETHKDAETALNAITFYTLLLHEMSIMPDFSNMGMVLKKDADGDWVEIDADECEI